jgi:quinohemoprotein amine dehydrogenase
MVKIRVGWLVPALLIVASMASSQPAPSPSPAAAKDEGMPIRSELVLSKCGGCHKADDQKRLSRISYRRATPENWEHTIRRMVTLNKVALEPADARKILKYLADNQGLAPEEARPVAFETERRTVDVSYVMTPTRRRRWCARRAIRSAAGRANGARVKSGVCCSRCTADTTRSSTISR